MKPAPPNHRGNIVTQQTGSGGSEVLLECKASSTLEAEQRTSSRGLLWPYSWLSCVFNLTFTPAVGRWVLGYDSHPRAPSPPQSCQPCLPSLVLWCAVCLHPLSPPLRARCTAGTWGPLWSRSGVTVGPHGCVQPSPPTMVLAQMGCASGMGETEGWVHSGMGEDRRQPVVMPETPASPLQQAEVDRSGGSPGSAGAGVQVLPS